MERVAPVDRFELVSPFEPRGDQPEAIAALGRGFAGGAKRQCLLGVTGSGKTFTMANLIAVLNKPTLVISHNKTLAAQLYEEFRRPALRGVSRPVPRQRGRVFRQLLRLLSARSLHPPARHLHRKRRLAQRRPRPPAAGRHQLGRVAPRRGGRCQRLMHLRPRLPGRL